MRQQMFTWREGAGKALGILGPLTEVSAFYVASQQIRGLCAAGWDLQQHASVIVLGSVFW